MAYDSEQCPSRGVGLQHITTDGWKCDHCGASRIGPAPSVLDWLKALRGNAPTVVVLSGEGRKPDDPDFAALTEREWHALIVERRHHERHQCDDR